MGGKINKIGPVYLHFCGFLSDLQPLTLTLRKFELQLLNLRFGLLPAMLGVSFTLQQALQLDGQLVPLGFQSLLGLLHRYFVLQDKSIECGDKSLVM